MEIEILSMLGPPAQGAKDSPAPVEGFCECLTEALLQVVARDVTKDCPPNSDQRLTKGAPRGECELHSAKAAPTSSSGTSLVPFPSLSPAGWADLPGGEELRQTVEANVPPKSMAACFGECVITELRQAGGPQDAHDSQDSLPAPDVPSAVSEPLPRGDSKSGGDEGPSLAPETEAVGRGVSPRLGDETSNTTDPERVRSKAQEAFRGRTQRLWGLWLRARGTTPSDTPARPIGDAVPGGNPATPESPGLDRRGPTPPHPPSVTASVEPPAALCHDGGAEPVCSEVQKEPDAAGETVSRTLSTVRPVLGGARETLPGRPSQPASPALQVARTVRMAIARGSNQVMVRLEPENLGKVRVTLTREGGGLAAHFRVESPQAHEALTMEVPMLRQALESRGVSVVHVSVDLEREAERGRDGWERPKDRGRRSDASSARADLPEEMDIAPSSWRPWGFEARV